jgi:transcriptional regulator with XRE-family HTH domain
VAEPPVTFAGALRKLRAEARLTQEELAEAAGLSLRSISDLERGIATTPRRETVRLLADVLQLTGPARAGFAAVARGRPVAAAAAVAAAAVAAAAVAAAAVDGAAVGGGAAAIRTLPRDISSFIGRQEELRELVDVAVGSGGVVGIHAIGGMAGVGKTAFAVHVAHQLAPRFPAGQIFLPPHGHTPGQQPVEPADALASLLLTAGVPAAQIPPGMEIGSAWNEAHALTGLGRCAVGTGDSSEAAALLRQALENLGLRRVACR